MRQSSRPMKVVRPEVDLMDPAIWVHRGAAPLMERPHRHDDLELNLVIRGRLDYLFGGTPLSVFAGQIAVFWAATPHRLIDGPGQEMGDNCWIHIPLATALSWGLPDDDLSTLLTNRPIILEATVAGRDVKPMFESWLVDLAGTETKQFALLEVQALVGRLLHHHLRFSLNESGSTVSDRAAGEGMRHVVQMAQFAVTHFRTSITPSDIAREAHLNPSYAMTLFRERVGTTLGSYLTRCRVAEAQRLLITTSMAAAEIAHAAGFGSQSSFYEHFTRMCGSSPSVYRRRLR
ncbi:MAG TPA: helix-turn-helix domain-containing protein [Humibacter sp.]|nr:helix-turn-helix domain-containing protein [Humibacter sp.]